MQQGIVSRPDWAAPFLWQLTQVGLSALFVLLLGYGLFSIPGLVRPSGISLAGLGLFAAFALVVVGALFARSLDRAAWIGFALLAVALRVVSAAIAASRVSPGDSYYYLVLAKGLLDGHGFVVFEPYMGVICRALYPPFYALLLAGWGGVAGFSTASLLVMSSAIDLGAAWVLVQIGARLRQERAGRTAAALYLIWPSVVFSAPLAQKESLCTLLVLALVHGWLRVTDGDAGRVRGTLAIGIPAALLALTQPGEAPLALLLGVALIPLVGWRRILATGMPAAAVAALVMAPWWIRNFLVLGAFVPLTTSGGIGLWIGNNAEATGNWMPYPPQLHGLGEVAFAHAAAGIASDWIIHHRVAFIRLTVAKFLHATAVGTFGVSRLRAMTPPLPTVLAALLLPLSHGAYLLLLAGGALAMRVQRNRASAILLALLVACFVQLAAFGVWFEFAERHREFLTPILLLTIAVMASRTRQVTQ